MSAAWRRSWQIGVQRWRMSRASAVCFAILALLATGILSVPFIALVFDSTLPAAVWQAPTLEHWLGTDQIGRDVFVQLLWACRASFGFALAASGVGLGLGVFCGALAGYYGGWRDRCLMRGTRMFESLPLLVLVIGVAACARLEWYVLALCAGAIAWMPTARCVRERMQTLRRCDFTTAAHIVGARPARIMWHHMAPHLIAVVGERALRGVGHMLLLEAMLSVLGLGPQAPRVSLGALLAEGVAQLDTHPHLFIAAAVSLTLIVYCLTALADAVAAYPSEAQAQVLRSNVGDPTASNDRREMRSSPTLGHVPVPRD